MATLVAGIIALGGAVPAAAQSAVANGSIALSDSGTATTLAGTVLTVTRDARPTSAARSAPAARGPMVRPVGVQAVAETRSAPADVDRDTDVSVGSNLALMGVGAAAVVVGLLVGGDGGTAIAVGGGVLGLIGLYRYLR